ncbi:MAG: AAA family ATPase [Clostridia bacterium]|nr:AAA family ATPase [Clostridia bacterium]
MFLDKFVLPIDQEETIIEIKMDQNGGPLGYIDNPYPCGVFSRKELHQVDFDKITILYGGNGSGKSTLLNLIASKLELKRMAPYNSSETFDLYVDHCGFEFGYDDEGFLQEIPENSRIITSDDIFDYMLAVRSNNFEISEEKDKVKQYHADLKFGDTIKMQGLQDYEKVRDQVQARRKTLSRRKFIRNLAGQEVRLNSNGETALNYFYANLQDNTLYCLDEPENSLSPKMQLELVKFLEEMAKYCGCQFIIATHSPFLLALSGAKIYDLDSTPVELKKWWELENPKTYFNFFYKNKQLFLKENNND